MAFRFIGVIPKFEGKQNIGVPLAAIFLAPLERQGTLQIALRGTLPPLYESRN